MNRRLIYIHDRRSTHQDRGHAYDVPESSALDSDCDLNALLKAVEADKGLEWDERGYRRRGPFFYCCRCNGIFLEWETTPARLISGLEPRIDEGQVCADCWHRVQYNLPIVEKVDDETRHVECGVL
jgi:hypothetical protein